MGNCKCKRLTNSMLLVQTFYAEFIKILSKKLRATVKTNNDNEFVKFYNRNIDQYK